MRGDALTRGRDQHGSQLPEVILRDFAFQPGDDMVEVVIESHSAITCLGGAVEGGKYPLPKNRLACKWIDRLCPSVRINFRDCLDRIIRAAFKKVRVEDQEGRGSKPIILRGMSLDGGGEYRELIVRKKVVFAIQRKAVPLLSRNRWC